MTEKTELRIALFVDFENLVTNTGITPAAFDLQPAIDRLLERGKVVFRRAFCDWSRFHDAKRGLHELGFELVDVPPSTRAGKNGADIRLVIDALELDFCPLAYKLRENDKRVIGLAVKEATSPFLVQACDEFIYLRPPGRASQPGSSEAPRRRKQSRGAERADPATVPAIAREVVSNLLAQATGPINPSLIKQTIVRKEPDFDERDHGFSTFSKLLGALEAEGLLRLQQMGRQWYVLPPDAKDGKETEPDAKDSKDAEEPAPPQS